MYLVIRTGYKTNDELDNDIANKINLQAEVLLLLDF